ncbi:MAG: DNA-protecting protein DprA [Bacteroidetes bacterium]|nr:MAG: DNA-protecting protein DprA [Bacteroidota bacterium]
MEDLFYKIAVTMIPDVGAVTTKSLISYCGGPQAVFEENKKNLEKIPGIGPALADKIVNHEVFEAAERELDFIQKFGIRPLFYLDKDYPARLKNFHDGPALLYYRGNADLNAYRTVAIIGTRKPTPKGVSVTENLVEGLKQFNVTTISGLAFGIDVAAHRKSLEMNIPTIGVLGHGLQKIYPAQHYDIASRMMENGGLLTEYWSFKKPDREHFPMRNRIVAGLCDALIVVESAKKGGSMITVNFANDYNKDVFAVPGRVGDENSQGCNLLIKSHRAALLESVHDLAYVMRWEEIDARKNIQRQMFNEFSEPEKLIVNLLRESEDVSVDTLAYKCGIVNSELAGLLLNLEFKGVIRAVPGNRYILL